MACQAEVPQRAKAGANGGTRTLMILLSLASEASASTVPPRSHIPCYKTAKLIQYIVCDAVMDKLGLPVLDRKAIEFIQYKYAPFDSLSFAQDIRLGLSARS